MIISIPSASKDDVKHGLFEKTMLNMVFSKRRCLFSKDDVSVCPLARQSARLKVNTG